MNIRGRLEMMQELKSIKEETETCNCGCENCQCNPGEEKTEENETILSDEEIEEIIKTEYGDKNKITKTFIRKSLKKYGNKFTYKKTEITNSKDKRVIVTCKIHGDTEVNPKNFHSKYCKFGCNKCRTFTETNGFADNINTFEAKLKIAHPYYELTENSVYINSTTDIELRCTKHNTVFKSRPSNLLMDKCGCNECVHEKLEQRNKNRIKEIGDNLFRTIEKDYPGLYNFNDSVYLGKYENITFKCNECGAYITMTGEQLSLKIYRHVGRLCKDCLKNFNKLEKSKKLKSKIETKFPGHFDMTNFKYENKYSITGLICKTCGKPFDIKWVSNFLRGAGCPHCDCSIGENYIRNWIINNDEAYTSYERHLDIDNSIIIGKRDDWGVEIDFVLYVGELTYWIEYNGEQHYTWCKHFQSTKEDFENQLKRDQNVRDYCKNNNIILIEIPWTYNKQEKIDKVLNMIILNHRTPSDVIVLPPISYYRTKKEKEEEAKENGE